MELVVLLLCLSIACLLAMPFVPASVANAHPWAFRQLTTALVALEFLLASALGTLHVAQGNGPLTTRLVDLMPSTGIEVGVFYDGAAGLMLLLVTFIGVVVSRFSVRYLDGDADQGRYFRWLSFTIGAVSLMVIAGHLLLFLAAWVMTSIGLHHLLLHYRHRAAAHRAAWTKFAISRLGDAFLVVALLLIYRAFGTLDISLLYEQVEAAGAASSPALIHSAIVWLLVLGAVTKSAQFPFHVWLPDTMETPTPVSALMHAGIVNAGGYLLIRMSPLTALAPDPMLILALIGTFTACFASVVMMTQPSVKRALAYSTIAQMGFMMLQCGLGAFAAAMLHIIAHSLYKAHAFLSSGSVISQSQATGSAAFPKLSRAHGAAALFVAVALTTAGYAAALHVFGLSLFDKPGGLVLALILCLALIAWSWRVLTLGRRQSTITAVAGMVGLSFFYVTNYIAIDYLLQPTMGRISVWSAPTWTLVTIAAAFSLLFALHVLFLLGTRTTWLARLRVHADSGFYIDALYQRVFTSLQKS